MLAEGGEGSVHPLSQRYPRSELRRSELDDAMQVQVQIEQAALSARPQLHA